MQRKDAAAADVAAEAAAVISARQKAEEDFLERTASVGNQLQHQQQVASVARHFTLRRPGAVEASGLGNAVQGAVEWETHTTRRLRE